MRLILCLGVIVLLSACGRPSHEDDAPHAYPGEVPASEMSEAEARSAERALEESLHMDAPAGQTAESEAAE
ncbi:MULTISPECIES: hypothetical protein [Asticcacaulis]|uniref:hypothetical protein n=1 Tax=Asticcacaulis TaxID=76890 RepID=UPI001AE4EA24|nr:MULTISPECIES: hypothetical protein [Asticcacaulis]MBP2161542.1 hypothetical protein [Asticcacaulis solisilvae]MDR6802607.1 hypothetical protein [Asticcacaulis sp. BE141]